MNKSFRMSLLLLTALVAISISSIPGSALGGNISISTTPSGAYIYLDNQYKGATPFIIKDALPGSHTIKLTLNQYDDWTTIIDVVEGSTNTISATLNKTAIYFSSTPSGAYIYLDNYQIGTTPFTKTQVSPGSHTIKLYLNQYDDWITTVNVVEGSTTPVSAELSIKSSTQNPTPTKITPIITSTSITPAPTYTTTPTPIATFAPKQTQTPLPFYSGGTTPTNTQTTETSWQNNILLYLISTGIVGLIVAVIGGLIVIVIGRLILAKSNKKG